MVDLAVRPSVIGTVASLILASVGMFAVTVSVGPHARADAVAYLVNVTARPGYNFASAEQALAAATHKS